MTDLYGVQCLTPVHIGSGEGSLLRDLDFIQVGPQKTILLDRERLLTVAMDRADVLAALSGRGSDSLARLIRERRLDPAPLTTRQINGRIEAGEIRTAVRSGDGRPLLPGSSLKGSLRTLLLASWLGDRRPHAGRNARAARVLCGALQASEQKRQSHIDEGFFRAANADVRGPQGDILRGLKVSDAFFAADDIHIVSSRALGTARRTLTAAEALKPGAQSVVRIITDAEPLLRHLRFNHELPEAMTLSEWSRDHARHLLEGEIKYFRERDDAEKPLRRCEELLATLAQLPIGTIALRLAWGTGWRTMTGDVIDEREQRSVMMRVGKTRKVVLTGHSARDEAADVFGWVRLDPISAAEARRRFVPPMGTVVPVAQEPKTMAATTPIKDTFALRLANFKASEFGQLRNLVNQAKARDNASELLGTLGVRLAEIYRGNRQRLARIRNDFPDLAPWL